MAKNLIPEICKMLGVELGEEFKVNLNGWNNTYRFNNNGLYGRTQTEKWIAYPELFCLLTTGNAEIIKMPWKPKKGETYYTFELLGDKWVVAAGSLHWGGFPNEYALLEKGWVYRSKEEAQTALPAVAKEIGVEYEL